MGPAYGGRSGGRREDSSPAKLPPTSSLCRWPSEARQAAGPELSGLAGRGEPSNGVPVRAPDEGSDSRFVWRELESAAWGSGREKKRKGSSVRPNTDTKAKGQGLIRLDVRC